MKRFSDDIHRFGDYVDCSSDELITYKERLNVRYDTASEFEKLRRIKDFFPTKKSVKKKTSITLPSKKVLNNINLPKK